MAQLVARLVRNEKVGGSNPPSSTTGRHPIADVGFLYAWARSCGACCCVDWCRWCSGRLLGRVVGPGRCVCRWAAARPRAVCAASFARRVAAKPGQAPPPPFTPVRPGVLVCSERHLDAWTGPAAAHSTVAMPSCALHTGGALGYRTKRVGFVVTFRLFGAGKSVLKLVGANLKDGLNVSVLQRLFGLLVRENPH